MRLLRAMRREIEAYERSRTVLYDLHDGEVRTRIHSLMVRLALALEGVSDASTKLLSVEAGLRDLTPGDPHDGALARQHDALQTERNSAFTYTLEAAAEIKPILGSLGAIAKQDFSPPTRRCPAIPSAAIRPTAPGKRCVTARTVLTTLPMRPRGIGGFVLRLANIDPERRQEPVLLVEGDFQPRPGWRGPRGRGH